LDFGFRRCVFFIHGGVTVLNGQIHNLNAAISAPNPNSSNGTTEVVVRQDPSAKAVGPSLKLGLIVYIR
jgi:FtsZ-interacting cell division protein YlmF